MISTMAATMEHADVIQSLIYPAYFQETIFSNLTYDADMTKQLIGEWINNNITGLVLVDGVIAGFAVMCLSRSFYKEIEADVEMFYILPQYRGTGASRALIDGLMKTGEANNVAVMYASCLSGISEKNEKLYINLWKKFGFKKLGTVMMRS